MFQQNVIFSEFKYFSTNIIWGKISLGRNVVGANVAGRKYRWGEMSWNHHYLYSNSSMEILNLKYLYIITHLHILKKATLKHRSLCYTKMKVILFRVFP